MIRIKLNFTKLVLTSRGRQNACNCKTFSVKINNSREKNHILFVCFGISNRNFPVIFHNKLEEQQKHNNNKIERKSKKFSIEKLRCVQKSFFFFFPPLKCV